jgi:O-antigen/teichoic acid export membrane protein
MLVCTITTSLYMVINAVYNTVFPRLTRAAALVSTDLLESEYLRGTRLMAALLFPVLVVLVLFPTEVLTAWTGSGILDGSTALVLSLLAVGTALHGLAHLPGALQFACGETRLSLLVNLFSLFLCAPLIWLLTRSFGILGGGMYSVALNLGMLVVHVGLMHRRLLPAARIAWLKANLGLLLVVVAGPLAARWLVPPPAGRLSSLAVLALVFLIAAVASASATGEFRKMILRRMGWGTPASTG